MRPVERIDNFLSIVDWIKLIIHRWGLSEEIHDSIYYDYQGDLKVLQQIITPYWKENPDQRIGQVLINLGLIPDSFIVWNDEESDILEAQGLPPEEYLFWGRNYDKNENLLPKIEWILVKNLDSDHINAIYEYALRHQSRLNPSYRKAFRNVLVQRSVPTDTLDRIETLWNLRA